jgi:hypothetical protein
MPELIGLLLPLLEYRAATTFMMLTLITLIRPAGLFGEKP